MTKFFDELGANLHSALLFIFQHGPPRPFMRDFRYRQSQDRSICDPQFILQLFDRLLPLEAQDRPPGP